MKVDRIVTVAGLSAFVVAFLFLAPAISYPIQPGAYSCPLNGCQFLRYGSITYWAFGVGATVRDVRGYSFSVVAATTAVTSTSSVSYSTTACSPAAIQENPLLTFRINVEYSGPWNATANGYANTTSNLAFVRCYTGDGNGWILISDWNPNGGAILNLTVQKMDASAGNLTATGNGQARSTTAPYGAVTMSLTAVP